MPDTPSPDGDNTLVDGCCHALVLLPVTNPNAADYTCTTCSGTVRAPWARALAGAGFDGMGKHVADRVGGTYGGAACDPVRRVPDHVESAPATEDPVIDEAPIAPGDTVYPAVGGPFAAFGAHRVIWRLDQGTAEWLWLVPETDRKATPRTMSAQFWTTTSPTAEHIARHEAQRAELAAEHERLMATGCDGSGRPLPRAHSYPLC